jgi:hypothetical protein
VIVHVNGKIEYLTDEEAAIVASSIRHTFSSYSKPPAVREYAFALADRFAKKYPQPRFRVFRNLLAWYWRRCPEWVIVALIVAWIVVVAWGLVIAG